MHQAVAYMQPRLSVPVISPGPVALTMAELLVQLGLSHSKKDSPQCGAGLQVLQPDRGGRVDAAGVGAATIGRRGGTVRAQAGHGPK